MLAFTLEMHEDSENKLCMSGSHSSMSISYIKSTITGTSLAVRWLGLRASTAGGTGSIPGRGTKIPHFMWHSQKKKVP